MLRRFWLRWALAALAVVWTGMLPAAEPAGRDMPTSGVADKGMAPFDRVMIEFMSKRHVPGGALAVVKDGRLVYCRGYGYADVERKLPVQPQSLFRIASISKPFTAVAIMTLAQDPKYHLDLDARAFAMLNAKPCLAPGAQFDERLNRITLRQLLHHTGGWDSHKSGDPMFNPFMIAKTVGTTPPADPTTIIRYELGRKLDFDPGARMAYSNFGYCVLGRVIESVTGMSCEAYVRQAVLKPMGIDGMRLGKSLLKDRDPREVRYYQGSATARPVLPTDAEKVPWPDGGFYLEAMDSHGGWLASAADLARFGACLDAGERKLDRPGIKCPLDAERLELLYSPPAAPVGHNAQGKVNEAYYACGWVVYTNRQGIRSYTHNGSLPGTFTLLHRRTDGLSFAALFNQRTDGQANPDGEIEQSLRTAAQSITAWPAGDLFSAIK